LLVSSFCTSKLVTSFSLCNSFTINFTNIGPLVQETKLAIVHIPLHLYSHFIQPILRLLTLTDGTDEVDGLPRRKWAYPNAFTNISVTTIECSVVCPRRLVDELFRPLIERLDAKAKQAVIISNDDFVVIQVGGEGMEAGQRVLDLTAPLALAGMQVNHLNLDVDFANLSQLNLLHHKLLQRLRARSLQLQINSHLRSGRARFRL